MHRHTSVRIEPIESRLLMAVSPLDFIPASAPTPLAVQLNAAPLTYVEKQGAAPIDPTLTISDPVNSNLQDASVQIVGYVLGEDVLAVPPQSGISAFWNPATGVLSLSGTTTASAYQSMLRSVSYSDASYNPTNSSRVVQITVTDAQPSTATAVRSIAITPVNDPPGIQTPPAQTISANSQLMFSTAGRNAIVISDVDANGATEQITLSAQGGVLRLGEVAGLTFLSGAASGGSTLTFTGTLSSINAAFDGLTFTPVPNSAGPFSVEVSANDLGHNGIGGAQIVNAVVPIVVTGIVRPPSPPVVGKPNLPPIPKPPPGPTSDPEPVVVSKPGVTSTHEIVVLGGVFSVTSPSSILDARPFASTRTVTPVTDLANVDRVTSAADSSAEFGSDGVRSQRERMQAVYYAAARRGDRLLLFRQSATDVRALPDMAVPVSLSHDLLHDGIPDRGSDALESIPRTDATPGPRGVRRRGGFALAAEDSAEVLPPFHGATMLRELDAIQRRSNSDLGLRLWAGSAALASAGVSAAYFLWLVRSGSLLGSVFSSIPAWKWVDPLPILEHANAAAMLKRDQDDGLAQLIKDASGA